MLRLFLFALVTQRQISVLCSTRSKNRPENMCAFVTKHVFLLELLHWCAEKGQKQTTLSSVISLSGVELRMKVLERRPREREIAIAHKLISRAFLSLTLSSRLLLRLCIINSQFCCVFSLSRLRVCLHKSIYFNVQKYSRKNKNAKNREKEEVKPTTRDATMKYSLTKY
jgi:hypothetical protein